jgi:hypothetical protein
MELTWELGDEAWSPSGEYTLVELTGASNDKIDNALAVNGCMGIPDNPFAGHLVSVFRTSTSYLMRGGSCSSAYRW